MGQGKKSGSSDAGYAGDLDAREAWQLLKAEDKSVLVDVRTRAEWSFVGVPDLSSLDKETILLEWQSFPPSPRPAAFADELAAEFGRRGIDRASPVLFLCRSGNRSRAAAIACTEAGFQRCHNVSDGFEGALDEERHRNTLNGWKRSGLPWMQS